MLKKLEACRNLVTFQPYRNIVGPRADQTFRTQLPLKCRSRSERDNCSKDVCSPCTAVGSDEGMPMGGNWRYIIVKLMESGSMPHLQFNFQSGGTSIRKQDSATTTKGAGPSIILSTENAYDQRPPECVQRWAWNIWRWGRGPVREDQDVGPYLEYQYHHSSC